jgi:tRNA A-37 threonylcarbamoyl transferase component Bud32/GAF domain-containing protein
MIVLAAATALYVGGADSLAGAALWNSMHPAACYASFVASLAVNLAVIVEGLYRYRVVHDANERRRIRMAVYTGVPSVLAYSAKDGIPIVAGLMGLGSVRYPGLVTALLQIMVVLPAIGLPYAVGVARVLGPRMVLRRSIRYALANRTLSIVAIAPLVALVVSLARNSDKTLAQLVTSGSGIYVGLVIAALAGIRYRDRARQWLDERFFREEYDARKILQSLVSRVRFETDPADLASLVLGQIDEALHPEQGAMLVSGVEPGLMVAVAARGQRGEPLRLDGGLATMLRWSDQPLDILLDDPRSPARRLPADEIAWLEATGTALLVPILGQDRALVGALQLGAKRSEEAYSTEDRELLATIAGQVSLGLDVARLRARGSAGERAGDVTTKAAPAVEPMMECPRCGRCEDASVAVCPADGAPMQRTAGIPRDLDNKYRIEQLIGRGGMGAVYRARDMRLDRLVAVKVVRAELLQDADARRRFRREAQLVARLQHPGIVSIFDFGTVGGGGAYLVMELVRGHDLRHVLQREGPLDARRTVRILTAVCDAIQAAHRDGVLHRDLKPENILLPDGAVEVKVLDFGVAKLISEETDGDTHPASATLTAAGSVLGTPAYMAPEQLRGEVPDQRTDVFALGVIAYEMLAGELPFGQGSFIDVALAHDRGPMPLSRRVPQVSEAIDRSIRQALAADRNRRPSTAQDFAAALTDALGAG